MRQRRLLVAGAVAIAAFGSLAASGLGDSLVYYRTPTEVVGSPPGPEATVRLGGMVAHGSIRPAAEGTRFVLTDGVTEVDVLHLGEVRGVFDEGQGALVEGSVGEDGVFRSQLLMVQHDNEYRAVEEAETR
jgi:cytochrome c-type biogenesis protein CcmE